MLGVGRKQVRSDVHAYLMRKLALEGLIQVFKGSYVWTIDWSEAKGTVHKPSI